jgi:hypothetical protein
MNNVPSLASAIGREGEVWSVDLHHNGHALLRFNLEPLSSISDVEGLAILDVTRDVDDRATSLLDTLFSTCENTIDELARASLRRQISKWIEAEFG